MKHSPLLTLAALLTAAWLSGCSDPADKVHKSSASDPQKPSGGSGAGKEYVIRAESTIAFTASKVTRTHQGGFKSFAGKINVGAGKIVGASEIKIGMPSIWADDPRLTQHLKSPDFFNVQQFPVATFTATSITGPASQPTITGNLDLHGVTKSVSFPAAVQVADNEVNLKAEFAINRRDFNVNYPGMPNDLIRDNVVLKLDIKATPGAARPEDQLAP